MADLSSKKLNAVSKFMDLAAKGMEIALEIQELNSFLTDSGFLTGGSAPLVDADFTGDAKHLDAATFNAAVSALNTVTLSNSNKTALRKALNIPAGID